MSMKNSGLAAAHFVIIASLLAAPACMSGAESTEAQQNEQLSASIARLKKQAGKGLVRVIVRVRVPNEERDATARAQHELMDAMQRVGVTNVDPIPEQPLIVMELNAAQLDELQSTGLVESIFDDTISTIEH